ncbi:hypothetical protein ACYCIE_25960, partial [Klebsiella pneumoniae]
NVSQIYRDLPAAIVPWIFSDTCRTQIKPARFGDASGVGGGGGGGPAAPPDPGRPPQRAPRAPACAEN